jgi:hypothetical protein
MFVSCEIQETKNTENTYTCNTCTACGVGDPHKSLSWLAGLIEKAETDATGNYKGTIWLVNHKRQDYFITNMMLGSGGTLYWIFNCVGSHFDNGNDCLLDNKHFTLPDDFPSLSNLELDIVVYSNVPF